MKINNVTLSLPIVTYLNKGHDKSKEAFTLLTVGCDNCTFNRFLFLIKWSWMISCLINPRIGANAIIDTMSN
jgi:hypothetical protein